MKIMVLNGSPRKQNTAAMHGSIDLPKEDLMQLKSLLDRALIKLEE